MNENDDYQQIAEMIGFASLEQFTHSSRVKIYEDYIRYALTAKTDGIQFTVSLEDTKNISGIFQRQTSVKQLL